MRVLDARYTAEIVPSMDESAVPALRVSGARRRIDGRPVLAGATLQVPRGRSVGLLGPNGAGKSSLLRAVAGRLRLDAGDVRIGTVTPAEARRQGRLGLVPQDVALYDHLTVRENLEVFGRLAGVPRRELAERVHAGLAWAGLAERATSRVTTLSGGMRRRVNLVAATLHHPDLLLLDEPTVGVDAEAQARLHELLRTLCARGMGLLIATHDADEAAALCDEVAIMRSGQVIAQDGVAALVSRVFGRSREVGLVLETPVPPAAQAHLAAAGYTPSADGRFVGRTAGTLDELGPLLHQLGDAGARVRETRVTEPHLRGAVAVLLDQPVGAAA